MDHHLGWFGGGTRERCLQRHQALLGGEPVGQGADPGNATLQGFSNGLWSATIILVLVDTVLLVIKLKRELKKRFGDEGTKGAVFYGVLRSMQLRFLRLPKPKVKIGQRLPERY